MSEKTDKLGRTGKSIGGRPAGSKSARSLRQNKIKQVLDYIDPLLAKALKKAEAILGSRPHWGAVEQAYIKAGMTRDDAIQQARLARILRWSDWHEEIQEIRLWTPTTK